MVLSVNDRVFMPERSVTVTAGDLHQLADDDDDDDVVAYTLRLDPVTLYDEGEYSCQVPSSQMLLQRHRIIVNGQSSSSLSSSSSSR